MDFFKKIFNNNEPDFKELVKKGALIIDVRSPSEFSTGHIKNSANIPVDSIDAKINELKKRSKAFITVCRSGARSNTAQAKLSSAGIEAYNGGPWFSLEKKLV